MPDTSSRLLRLLSLLQARRHWAGSDLAERLDVSPRTVRRDVERLRDLGYPVEAHRGVDGGYQLVSGGALPPLSLEDDEAVALAIGLRAAAQGAVAGIEGAAMQALAKIVQIMPPRLRARVDALDAVTVPAMRSGEPTVEVAILTTVAQACRDHERLRFYYTARSGDLTDRRVEPHRLVSLGTRWYLVAYDLDRQDWRTFRLDRITEPKGAALRFRPRDLPGEDAAAFVTQAIDRIPAAYEIEVLVDAPPERIREAVGRWGEIDPAAEGRSLLRMSVDSLDWPAFALGTIGARFEVVRPPELVDLLREWGQRFLRSTGE